jgi:pyruvate dehydrogenase E2 component (dihydrolipoamide acetyltransferase)
MAVVVRMPSVLAGATEAALASWLVAVGDTVSVGTPIAEIETEKAMVEYAAEEAGIVGRLVLGAGDTGEIGDPIAVLVAAGETDADIDAALGGATVASAASVSPAAAPMAHSGQTDGASGSVAVSPGSAVSGAPTGAGTNGHAAGAPAASGRIFASPLVRKVAGERGVDLAAVTGTGPNGRIVRRDLEQWLAAGEAAPVPYRDAVPGAAPAVAPAPVLAVTAAAPAAPSAVPAGARLIPHSPMRRAIARRLTESKATTPHFYMVTECVVDELLALRKRVNETVPVKVSVNDFVIAAVAAAFGDVPEANVTWTDDGLLARDSVDISIAVATESGLVTPVLHGVEAMKLSGIAKASAALAQRARDKRLQQHELEGGTLAVSNLGMYGTVEFSAIINPPQSGILAVGAAKAQPVVVDGEVRAATVMRCTLSVDHRAIDGALAARWLAAFTARLESPLGALV